MAKKIGTDKKIKVEMTDGKINVRSDQGKVEPSELYVAMFGLDSLPAFNMMLTQAKQAMPEHYDEDCATNFVMAMLMELKPQDALEAMLISQMIATHSLAMEMTRRATLTDQTIEGVDTNVNRLAKLMRTFTMQMEALQRKRNKGQQVIQVQHIQINDGGKAVVANVGGANE